MKTNLLFVITLFAGLFLLGSCCTCKKDARQNSNTVKIPAPQAIIYTTTADYSNLVPVILTSDKNGLESYPDIKDVYYNGNLAFPTFLHKGFLLDNRGISQNVAFIKLTYQQYASLPATPTADEIMQMIVDKNPIDKMYSCGPRSKFANLTDDLNALIDKDDFSGFKRIK